MSKLRIFYFLTFILLIICSNILAQQNTIHEPDQKIFKLIKEERAFCGWQLSWSKIWQGFDLFNFRLADENDIKLLPVGKITIEKLRERNHLVLTFFSPNGEKAIDPFSYFEVYRKDEQYRLGKDDHNSIRLYDFSTDSSYLLQDLSNYGPFLNGISWLNDDLIVIVGYCYREIDKKSENAPLIFIFDLENMKVRKYVGKYFLSKEAIKHKINSFINEAKLIFEYEKIK